MEPQLKLQGLSTVRCAKTVEPIEMQFGMLSRVGPRNITWGVAVPTGRDIFGSVRSIEKNCKAYDFGGSAKG